MNKTELKILADKLLATYETEWSEITEKSFCNASKYLVVLEGYDVK